MIVHKVTIKQKGGVFGSAHKVVPLLFVFLIVSYNIIIHRCVGAISCVFTFAGCVIYYAFTCWYLLLTSSVLGCDFKNVLHDFFVLFSKLQVSSLYHF